MTPKIYPGMLDARIEYFAEGPQVYKIKKGAVKKFEDVKEHRELQFIIENETGLQDILSKMCNNDQREMQQKLASCRFGALNFEADFDHLGNASHDFVDCHLRGNCIGEHIVCKPLVLKGEEITEKQLEILRGCASNLTNEVLAEIVDMPLGSFNVLKQKTYKQLHIQTKQEGVLLLTQNGLL